MSSGTRQQWTHPLLLFLFAGGGGNDNNNSAVGQCESTIRSVRERGAVVYSRRRRRRTVAANHQSAANLATLKVLTPEKTADF